MSRGSSGGNGLRYLIIWGVIVAIFLALALMSFGLDRGR